MIILEYESPNYISKNCSIFSNNPIKGRVQQVLC